MSGVSFKPRAKTSRRYSDKPRWKRPPLTRSCICWSYSSVNEAAFTQRKQHRHSEQQITVALWTAVDISRHLTRLSAYNSRLWWLHYRNTNKAELEFRCLRKLLPTGSAAGSSAGIVFTHGPILGFFARRRHVAPIKVEFGVEERTVGPLLRAKFPHDRFRGGGLRPPKLKKNRILQI